MIKSETAVKHYSISNDFPILNRKIHGKRLVYLDSAATTQRPIQVINAINDFYTNYNSNIHRGLHTLSDEATVKYENSRKIIAEFINANFKEVIFVKNTTEGINLVAKTLGEEIINENDTILVTAMEHHSNFVPWQQLAHKKKAKFEIVPITKEGKLDLDKAKELLARRPKIFAVNYVSNVIGNINPIKELVKIAHQYGAYVVVDAAQAVPHIKVDVKELDCDFLAFSGHKMLGPTGIGVLYGKKEILEKMQPFLTGGDMIKEVGFKDTTWNDLPWKFEAGTQDISGVIGLGAAVEYLNKIGIENFQEHDKILKEYTLQRLKAIPEITVYGEPDIGIISFNLADIHSHDLATVLDEEGVAVRSGHHCAAPMMKSLSLNGTCRASFYIYNTKDDVDVLIDALKKAKEIFKC